MKDIILKQVEKYYNKDQHEKIISTITNFPRYENDYELAGQLARAYNNNKQYSQAIDLLLLSSEQGINDPIWVYRLAYSHCVGTKEYHKVQKYIENILNNIPADNQDDEVYKDLSDFLIICLENDVDNLSFKKRVENFWVWFTENEEKLSNMIDSMKNNTVTNSDEITDFVSAGISIISDKLHFNFGGDYEFGFSCKANPSIFYTTPYLISKMPREFKDKWTFIPFLMGQTDGFSMNLPGINNPIHIADIFVAVDYGDGVNHTGFNLQFYNENLSPLDDNLAYNTFLIMVNFAIGDAIGHIYINKVIKSDLKLDHMIPLTDLKQNIIDTLKERDRKLFSNPKDRFITFKMEIEHDDKSPLRYEVNFGTTSFHELQNEYYAKNNSINLTLLKMGVYTAFVIVQDHEGLNDKTFKNTQKITDEIVALGTSINIGRSVGAFVYIDFIIYDINEFLSKIPAIFKKYPYKFHLSYFRHNSDIIHFNQL